MLKKLLCTALTVVVAAVMSFAAFCTEAAAVNAPKLTKTSLTLAVGDKYQIYVNNAIDTIKWSSSNSKTASVSKGLVTAKKAGTVTITAKHGSVSLKCRVTVKANAKKYTFRTKSLCDEHYKKHSAEFGHMTLHPGGEPCYCGQRGCAYVYINTRRLSEVAGGELKRFFELLKADDPACRQAWDSYLADLSMVIGNIRTALDCSVVIGGYLGWYIGPYMADVRARLAQRNMFEKSGDYAIACTKVIEITAVGAALSCQHAAIQNMIAGGCADVAADDSADP